MHSSDKMERRNKRERELVVDISSLPDVSQPEVDFIDTSFFQFNGTSPVPRLPSPTEIHHQGGVLNSKP